jgi:adenosylmethionine-8-amino-7-oxononanoate aminotransferase
MEHRESFLADPRKALEFVHSEKEYLIDAAGNRYIDFLSSWCVGNTGWSNNIIKDAIRNFDGPDYVAPRNFYEPRERLARQLIDAAPGELEVVFRATGGTEAVDIALQLAMAHTKRKKFISIKDCYHGNSIATRSLAGDDFLPGCTQIPTPLDGKALRKLESLLRKQDVAAFIMEPVICNLAVYIPDSGFMTEAQGLCREYGTLLILDEVASGFYRTGTMFACEHYGLTPDIICLAKAMTDGYAPIGATLTTRNVAKSAERQGLQFYSTYGWHPLSVAAALANMEYLRSHHGRLLRSITEIGRLIEDRIMEMEFRRPPEIRRIGLAIAVDLGDEYYAPALEEKCRHDGLLISSDGASLTMFPPLNTSAQTAHQALDILEQNVERLSPVRRRYEAEMRQHVLR